MTSKTPASTFLAILLCLSVAGVASSHAADAKEKPSEKTEPVEPVEESEAADPEVEADDPDEAERKEEAAAVALPVSSDPVQIFGWKEWVHMTDGDAELKVAAKLDTGAYTSSIHAEEKELFERDGKKWVRFVVTDPRAEKPTRIRMEAPLVRIARVKDPGGEPEEREVVRITFRIHDRKMKADFTLSNRGNMLNPMLIGRVTIRELGWVDPSRAFIAEKKLMR